MACTTCQKGAFGKIIEGWGNYLFPDKEIENVAKIRALTCATCNHNRLGMCTDCGCLISPKTRTKEKTCYKWKL